MTDPLPDGYVVHLPPPKQPKIPHVFEAEVRVPPHHSISGEEQIERTCKTCGAVKITIMGKDDNQRRAWRKDGEQVETYLALPCEPPFGTAP